MQFLTSKILVLVTLIATISANPTHIKQTAPSKSNQTTQGHFKHTPRAHCHNQTADVSSLEAREDKIPLFEKNDNGEGYCTKGAIAGSAFPNGCALAFWYPWNIKQTAPAEESAGTLYVYNRVCDLLGLRSAEGKFKYSPAGLDKAITVFNADPFQLTFSYGSGDLLGPLNCGEFKTSKDGTGFGFVCPFDCSA